MIKNVLLSLFSYSLVYLIFVFLMKLKNRPIDNEDDNYEYVVMFPMYLRVTGIISMVIGTIIGVYMFIGYCQKKQGFTAEHVYIGLVFLLIGMILVIVWHSWKIMVNVNSFIFCGLFHKPFKVDINQIDQVNDKGEFLIIKTKEKVVSRVDHDCDNYERIRDKFEKEGFIG